MEEQAIIDQARQAAQRLADELDRRRQEMAKYPVAQEALNAAAAGARRVLAALNSSDEPRVK